jgi:hypothetical protein
MPRRQSLIEVANDQVSMTVVCHRVGISLPDYIPEGRSFKVFCPFGSVSHGDGGQEEALRIYPDTNSGYCFACSSWYGPVKLWALSKDIPQQEAAEELLQSIGWRPPDPFEAIEAAMAYVKPMDQSSLAEALKTFCSRISPTWENRQFDPDVSRTLGKCLGLLPRVRTAAEAREWLDVTKTVMTTALTRDKPVATRGS